MDGIKGSFHTNTTCTLCLLSRETLLQLFPLHITWQQTRSGETESIQAQTPPVITMSLPRTAVFSAGYGTLQLQSYPYCKEHTRSMSHNPHGKTLTSLPPVAGCCTVLSVFGLFILIGFGLTFEYTDILTGSTEDPVDGRAVALVCYYAAAVYAALILFCGCQVSTIFGSILMSCRAVELIRLPSTIDERSSSILQVPSRSLVMIQWPLYLTFLFLAL